jgi:hypothetical protein
MDGNLLANVMENQCICKQIANIFAKMSEKAHDGSSPPR